jgi:hypothetical protein
MVDQWQTLRGLAMNGEGMVYETGSIESELARLRRRREARISHRVGRRSLRHLVEHRAGSFAPVQGPDRSPLSTPRER